MKKLLLLPILALLLGCNAVEEDSRIPIIIDTDANNELDDQHALAYLFFNDDIFHTKGVTVNATYNGGAIEGHYEEAKRVMQLCDVYGKIPLLKGANKDYEEILPDLEQPDYDGHEAVDFIISEAQNVKEGKLTLVPIGKLTNIALAIKKAPEIKDKIRVVWLGANYPDPGEYNLVNDIPSMNYILDQEVPFEMVMVRYGEATGSDAVRISPEDVDKNLKGNGPKVDPVEGRHGGSFTSFGDYSANLFSKIDLHGDPPSRALFDVVALAVIKNPEWGEVGLVPAPTMIDSLWQDRPENPRQVSIWENFNETAIVEDFFESVKGGGQ